MDGHQLDLIILRDRVLDGTHDCIVVHVWETDVLSRLGFGNQSQRYVKSNNMCWRVTNISCVTLRWYKALLMTIIVY